MSKVDMGAIYGVEIGRDENDQPYAILKGHIVEDGQERGKAGDPRVETLLRRDDETGLWAPVESRIESEFGWDILRLAEGMAENPLDLAREFLEGTHE